MEQHSRLELGCSPPNLQIFVRGNLLILAPGVVRRVPLWSADPLLLAWSCCLFISGFTCSLSVIIAAPIPQPLQIYVCDLTVNLQLIY